MNLTKRQTDAYSAFLNGENIFITGPGGCGKSYFIQHIYKNAINEGKNIKVTSLTGCSAILLNCKATTIHKWGCLGIGTGNELSIYRKIVQRKQTLNYIDTDILVIDEISMLNQYLFEVLDYLCKKIRKCELPFGGIQVVASGDFYQLPPVCTDSDNMIQSRFCFQSNLWDTIFEPQNQFIFDVNFRQNDDKEYFKMLQEIRCGTPSFDTIENLVLCSKKKFIESEDNASKPTYIYPTKKMVDKINQQEINKLMTIVNVVSHTYVCGLKKQETMISDKFIQEKDVKHEYDHLMKNGIFENKLELCAGCQVMCISNIDQELGLVNGSQGIVTGFNSEDGAHYPIIKFDNIEQEITIRQHCWTLETNKNYCISQIPLILSWAITIHKSQGMSIDKAVVDIGSSIFQYGQTYVALSRVKSLLGLYLTKVNAQKIKAHPDVIKYYKKIE
tara:strand:+ start:202 stop:1536 length:1335 start_codon:yes stop_codon:yes gene_type:complete